jgi:hypothetical protein
METNSVIVWKGRVGIFVRSAPNSGVFTPTDGDPVEIVISRDGERDACNAAADWCARPRADR